MSPSPAVHVAALSEPADRVAGRLEQARSGLEARFLEGGEVLSQALGVVNELVGVLDKVTSAFGKDAVEATIKDLAATSQHLRALPQSHAARQAPMARLASAGNAIQDDVDAMLETLRYLRSFAVTVKITGAGAGAFTAFADEMLERIQLARTQVDEFAGLLRRMREQVRSANAFGRELMVQYDGSVPQLASNLARDAARVGEHHAEIQAVASALTDLARQVQGKVAKVLSALQIGDITRQRVEHVQAGLAMVGEAGGTHRPALLALLAAQMDDLAEEFQSGCMTVTSSLGGLAADVKEIVALGRKVRGGADASGEGFLRALEKSVASAREMVGELEQAAVHAGQTGQSSAETAGELIRTVSGIRAIRSDIQYMAINTSLRCSRMGEAGKPMNVVASELRVFAEKMEMVADKLLTGLNELSATAEQAKAGGGDVSSSLGDSLDSALAKITDAEMRVAGDLKDLSARGDEVARSVGQGVSRLDFTRELGEILEECSYTLAQAAADNAVEADPEASLAAAAPLAERLFAKYTMARERTVHRRCFPAEAVAEAAPAVAPAADDLDAVLF